MSDFGGGSDAPSGPSLGSYFSGGLSIGGGILGFLGGQNAASGAIAAGNQTALGYQENAIEAGNRAAQIMMSLQRQERQAQYQENSLLGRQRAAFGGAFVNPASGSPLDVMGDTENRYKFLAMNRAAEANIASGQAGEQYGFDMQDAAAAKAAARTTASSDVLGGALSLAKGIGGAIPLISSIFGF